MADDPQIGDVSPPDLLDLANANADALSRALGIPKDMPAFINGSIKWALYTITVLLRSSTRIVTYIVITAQKVLEADNPEVARLAVHILGTLFGTDLQDQISAGIFTNEGLANLSEQVGHSVLQAVFGDTVNETGGAIEPSTVPAERFLGSITELVTRGFVLGAVVEVFSLGQIKLINELEEEIIAGLGLGRMARQALRPFVHVLLALPAEWKVNLAHRPTLLPIDVAIRNWLTGTWGADELDQELGKHGYSSDRVDALVNAHVKQDDETTLHTLVLHDAATEDELKTALVASGMQLATAEKRVQAWRLSRQDVWLGKYHDMVINRYIEGLVDQGVLRNDLRLGGAPADVIDAMIQYAEIARELPRKLLSEADAREAWTKSIITQNEYHDHLIRLGYTEDDATTKILLNLTNVRDRAEAAQAKKQAAADRKAALDAAKQQKIDDAAHAKAAAAADRAAKAAALAAHRSKIAADQLALKTFIADAARRKQTLVDQLHAKQLLTDDAATLARAQIAADEAALLATIAGQEAAAKASFERQLLELRQEDRQATIDQQLADVELALEADRALRTQTVTRRVADVDAVLALKLDDLAEIYTARERTIAEDLADGIAAINTAVLPSEEERRADAARKIAELDVELARKLTDLQTDTLHRHAAIDGNLGDGLIKAPAAALQHAHVDLSADTAARLAQQQHDISVSRLQTVAGQADALAFHEADKQKTALEHRAAAASKTLAAERLKAELAARQAADVEKIALATIANQVAPITEAEAARRRRQINLAAAAAQRAERITETEIAKGEASAKAATDKANAGVTAARQRLQQTQAAAGARENAQSAAAAALESLQATIDGQRALLEVQLAADQAGAPADVAA